MIVDEVAEAALFFASFESNALTGQSLTVSHGWSMQRSLGSDTAAGHMEDTGPLASAVSHRRWRGDGAQTPNGFATSAAVPSGPSNSQIITS